MNVCVRPKKMVLPHKHMPKAYLRLRMFEMGRLGDFAFRMKLRGRQVHSLSQNI